MATGTSFPDALAASALLGRSSGVLLLTDGSGSSVASDLRSHASEISHVYILGGTAVVSASAYDTVSSALS